MFNPPPPASVFLNKTLTPIEVLVIESDPSDALKTLVAFRAAGLTSGVHCIQEGEDALNYLRREGPYATARIPDLIFLDLCQPRISGLTALKLIRSTPALKHIPVIVAVDAGDDPEFVQNVHSLNGNGFIQKPVELTQFLRCIESSYEYWVSVVTLGRKPVASVPKVAEASAGEAI